MSQPDIDEPTRRVRPRTDNDGGGGSGGVSGSPLSSAQPNNECGTVQLNIGMQLGLQFDDPTLSDVTLVWVDDQGDQRCFRCHKVVLASMSTYFHALFTAGMAESSQKEVVLQTSFDGDLVERVLRLLYGFAEDITADNVLVMSHLADFCAPRTPPTALTAACVRPDRCVMRLTRLAPIRLLGRWHHAAAQPHRVDSRGFCHRERGQLLCQARRGRRPRLHSGAAALPARPALRLCRGRSAAGIRQPRARRLR